jgi:hypothetical protein
MIGRRKPCTRKISVQITYIKSLLLPLSPGMSHSRLMYGVSGANYKKEEGKRREKKGGREEEERRRRRDTIWSCTMNSCTRKFAVGRGKIRALASSTI